MILNASLCEMNRMAIVPSNEFFELDAPASSATLQRRYFSARSP